MSSYRPCGFSTRISQWDACDSSQVINSRHDPTPRWTGHCFAGISVVTEGVDSLVTPLVSVAIAVVFVWRLPINRKRKDLAIDLYKLFNSDGMYNARREAWTYLHKAESPAELSNRVARFWVWSMELGERSELATELPQLMCVRRVFDFWSTCEQCLVQNEVDPKLLKALLGYAFARWSADNIERLVRSDPPAVIDTSPTGQTGWLEGMPCFRALCGFKSTPSLAQLRHEKSLRMKDLASTSTDRLPRKPSQ